MPVTVKFSRDFYDKFGHEAVDELVNHLNQVDATYRSELRELNALHFARFDDKLERRVTQLDAKIDRRAAELEAKIEQRAAQLEARIEQTKAELIKWMFVFWAPTALGVGALLLRG
jgi:DNA anti-recombination protein RmuC